MNKLLWTLLLSLVVLAAAYPAHAGNLPVRVDGFRIDNIEMVDNAFNRLDLQRDRGYEAEIRFTPTDFVKDMQVKVFASGFEFSDVSPIEDTSRVFDADANVTYVRRFQLKLTDQVDEDDYKIRILFTDRNNNEIVKSYNVKFDIQRHMLKIVDTVFYPASGVQAGEALLTTVRIENQGEKVENDVRVDVSIPALGISGVDYIDEIKNGGNREKGTEEIFMRIPDCTKPGTYDVMAKVFYNQLHDVVVAHSRVDVVANPICGKEQRTVPDTVVVYKSGTPPSQGQPLPNKEPANPAEESKSGTKTDTSTVFDKARNVLEIVLLVLIALLVIIAGVLAFRGLNKEDDNL